MTWLVALGFLSLGASFGFLLGAGLSRWDAMQAFGEGVRFERECQRQELQDLIPNYEGQVDAAREGRQ